MFKKICKIVGAVITVIGCTIAIFLLGSKSDRRGSSGTSDADRDCGEGLGKCEDGLERIEEGISRSEERIERIEEGITRSEERIAECEKRLSRAEEILRKAIDRSKTEKCPSDNQ